MYAALDIVGSLLVVMTISGPLYIGATQAADNAFPMAQSSEN
jgi:hypothetical protein